MTEFFRFPHTEHLAWLGKDSPREDKVINEATRDEFLSKPISIEEKIDGANLGLTVRGDGTLQVQNRGQILTPPFTGQFSRLGDWLAIHEDDLLASLQGTDLTLFGEWCAARHSISYLRLPDWFIAFDVYDRKEEKFWSALRRNDLIMDFGIACIHELAHGRFSLDQVIRTLDMPSVYGAIHIEGLVLRQDEHDWCTSRKKIVRADFTQSMDTHWRSRRIEWNRLA